MDDSEYCKRLSSFVPTAARETTIPLLVKRGQTFAQHGCGTLFALDSDRFLVTARHVVSKAIQAGNSLYAGLDNGTFVLLSGTWMISDDNNSAGVLDVASLKLNGKLRAHLNEIPSLRLSEVSFDFDASDAVYCFFGYPSIWTHDKHKSSEIRMKAIQFLTYAFEGATTSFANFDPHFHIALNASLDEACDEEANPATFQYRNGIRASFPGELDGISGCSIWHVGNRRHGLDKWPTVDPKIVAVETCVYTDKKGVIRGTRWNSIATLLHRCFPETRAVLALHGIA